MSDFLPLDAASLSNADSSMGWGAACRLLALCLAVVMLGCGVTPPRQPDRVVRGPGLPPTTLVAPFKAWAGSAPVPAGGLLEDGEHARGPVGQTQPAPAEKLAPPTIEGVDTDWSGHLNVRFNREVCPRDEDASSVLEVTPEREGKAYWETPDRLVFEPTKPWPTATKLVVKVAAKLCSTARLAQAERLETVHRPLRRAYLSRSRPLGKREGFRIAFSDSVDVSAVQAAIIVEELDGGGSAVRQIPVKVAVATKKNRTTVDDAFQVEPQKGWPRDRRLRVSVGAKMRGLGGAALVHPLVVELRSWGPQQITAGCSREVPRKECKAGEADARGLEVLFENGLAQRSVFGVQVSPKPKGMRMSLDGRHRLVITGALKLGETYSVTVPAGLVDRFGQRTTDKTTLSFQVGLPLPSIEVEVGDKSESRWRSSARASMRVDRAKIGITTRRMKTVKVRVSKVPDDRLVDFVGGRTSKVAKGLPALVDKTLTITPAGPTRFSSLAVDLPKLVGNARGALAITVSPGDQTDPKAAEPEAQQQLVQLGDIGLTVGASAHGHEIRVASLIDGRPVAGAKIAAVITDEKGTKRKALGVTNAAGHLHVAPQKTLPLDARVVIVARGPKGDEALVRVDDWGMGDRKSDDLLAPNETLLGHLVTERGIYKPGETIHVVAWAKIGSPNVALGRRALPKGTELIVKLEADEVVAEKKVTVTGHGKITASLDLDAEAVTGRYKATLLHRPTSEVVDTRYVRVEHYRTPAFMAEVASVKQDGLARATFVVTAKHYSGEPLDIVGATVGPRCWSTRPPSSDFGLGYEWDVGYSPDGSDHGVKVTASKPTMVKPAREVTVRLDASGLTTGRSELCGVKADLMARTLQSQANASSPEVQLYGATEAVALRVSKPKRKGERRIVSLRAVTHVGDGAMKRVSWPEPVDVLLSTGSGKPKKVCTVRLGARIDGRCRLGKLEPWERYEVQVRDRSGLIASTSFWERRWYSPQPVRRAKRPPPKEEQRCVSFDGVKQCYEVTIDPEFDAPTKTKKQRPESLSIVPETSTVLVGERARVALRGPWDEAAGMLIVRTVGAAQAVPFTMRDGRAQVAIAVRPSWESGVSLRAWVTPPTKADATATHHEAERWLDVLDRDRSLMVRIEAPKKASVRETKRITVEVTDPAGKPVKGRVAIWVSDRAVLDLTGYRLPINEELAPHPKLHGMTVVERYDALRMPFVPRKEGVYFMHGTGTGQGFGSGHGRLGRSHRSRPPRVRGGMTSVERARGDFRTTPLFVGDVATDAKGRATVDLKLPDNVTEFVVMAVASAGLEDPKIPERFGRARSSITVSKSVVLTAALPRHLRPGDSARVAAVVRNNGSKPIDVEIKASVQGEALTLKGEAKKVTIASGKDHRVSFEVTAAKVGTATVRMDAAVVGAMGDAVVLPLTVAEERLRYEEDGMQGVIAAADEPDQKGVTIPIELAKGIAAKDVEVRVSFGRSPITGLEAAAASLMRFPYGCVEQLSSKLVPLIAVEELRDMGVVDQNPDAFIGATVRSILDHQREDGGFGLWSSEGEAHDYGSAWATWVLVTASRAGVKVSDKALDRAIDFAKRMQDREASVEAKTLALLAIADHGKSAAWVKERLRGLIANPPKGAFAMGMLAMSSRDASPKTKQSLVKVVLGMLEVRGNQAGVAAPALAHGAPMGARVPGTAALMMGLMALSPKSPVLHKLAAGLLAQRHRGRWPATQDNAFALLALSRYARLVGKPVAVQAKGWVGTTPVVDDKLTDGKPIARSTWTPLGKLRAATVQRIGKGPIHYMLRVRRMRDNGEIPKSQVLTVKRTLRTATGKVGDSVTAGQILALDVEVHASQPVGYVAIDVPVPAGLEPAIVGLRGKLDAMLGDKARARSPIVSHHQSLPDRVVIFADRVPPGTHRYTVYVRAVTPGTYDFPAARAMAQYAPSVQGWSVAQRLRVTERVQ